MPDDLKTDRTPAATITLYDAENTIDIRLDIPDDVDPEKSPAATTALTLLKSLQRLKEELQRLKDEEPPTDSIAEGTAASDANSTEHIMAEPAEPLQ